VGDDRIPGRFPARGEARRPSRLGGKRQWCPCTSTASPERGGGGNDITPDAVTPLPAISHVVAIMMSFFGLKSLFVFGCQALIEGCSPRERSGSG